jgi:hypothetical protein
MVVDDGMMDGGTREGLIALYDEVCGCYDVRSIVVNEKCDRSKRWVIFKVPIEDFSLGLLTSSMTIICDFLT